MFLRVLGSALLTTGLIAAANAEPRLISGKTDSAPEVKAIAAPVATTSPDAKAALPFANILQAPLFKTSLAGSTEAKIDESA